MRRLWMLVVLLIIVLGLTGIRSLGADSQSLQSNPAQFEIDNSGFTGSQGEMNENADKEFKRADDKLNEIYQRILLEYKKNKRFLVKLTKAEKAWLKFRDAHLEALYPEENKQYYGSAFPMCFFLAKAQLTWDKVKQLDEWLHPDESDIGQGSRGQKEP